MYKIDSPIIIGETSWQLLSESEKENIQSFAKKYSTEIAVIEKDTYYLPHYISDPYNSIALTTTIYNEFRECFDCSELRSKIDMDKQRIISMIGDYIIRSKVISILENDYNYKIYK